MTTRKEQLTDAIAEVRGICLTLDGVITGCNTAMINILKVEELSEKQSFVNLIGESSAYLDFVRAQLESRVEGWKKVIDDIELKEELNESGN